MAIVQKTTTALNGIPFGDILAGPLNACVDAQAQAAYTTMNFINEIGLVSKEVNGVEIKEAVYVYFTYKQGGETVQISVPLLSIVPIPYIAIDNIDIDFTCSVSGIETKTHSDQSNVSAVKVENAKGNTTSVAVSKGKAAFSHEVRQFKASVSSKRSSVNTRDSQFSIEATIDVHVHARQDSMPAGMAKVLEIFNSSIDLTKKE